MRLLSLLSLPAHSWVLASWAVTLCHGRRVVVDGDVGVDRCCSIVLSHGRVAILGVSKFFKK